jgi:hypothetical protein
VQASLRLLGLGPEVVTFSVYSELWRAVLGHVDDSLHLTGHTGAGETALAVLLQQHFGATMHAKALPGSWISTANALAAQAFLIQDAASITASATRHSLSLSPCSSWRTKGSRGARA